MLSVLRDHRGYLQPPEKRLLRQLKLELEQHMDLEDVRLAPHELKQR